MRSARGLVVAGIAALVGPLLAAPGASAGADASAGGRDRAAAVAAHWDEGRIAAAQPRDLVLDENGAAHLRRSDGSLVAYGSNGGEVVRPRISAVPSVSERTPRAKPPSGGGGGGGGGGDTTPPSIDGMTPASGETIGASATFGATVTDAGGVKSVTFVVTYPNGSTTQSFTANNSGGDTWATTLQGFTDGAWSWHVVATDTARKGGNTATSAAQPFLVDTGGSPPPPPPGGDVVTGDRWSFGGDVQTAAGRIYFEMPSNRKATRWSGYVCSGTVMTDGASGRSVIITAAHCVYDDVAKVFARNVLFIPDQDGTTGTGTDSNCTNDPLGCWAPDHGVVDVDWTTRTFPDNIPWDYGYYVVGDDAHAGSGSAGPLDTIAGDLPVEWSTPAVGSTAHALGYSYSDDPYFMYCKETMGTEGADNWWLPSCGLSGGSSGGPWIQPMDEPTGTGSIISVNSWGYSTSPGMAGPKLSGTSAQCLFNLATSTVLGEVSGRGVAGC